MGDLLAALKEQGFESLDAAFEHLKALREAEERAKAAHASGDALDVESAKRIIGEVVDQRLTALGAKAADAKPVINPELPVDEREVRELQFDMFLLAHVLRRDPRQLDAERLARAYRRHLGKQFRPGSIRKALDTTDASALVPTELSRSMLTDVEKASVILANFRVMDMPTNPWKWPYQSSSLTAYGVDQSTADDASAVGASDPGVDEVTFSALKIGARALWSRELDEDSAISMLPIIREDFLRVTRDSWERVFIFGDETVSTANINNYGTTPTTTAGAKDYWLQGDGLVHHCLVTNTGQASDIAAAITGARFLAVRALMGKYGDRPDDLFVIMTRDLLYDAMALDEFKTVDKYGDKATVLTGELGKMYGSPCGVSDGLPKTAAAGYIDDTAGNNTKKSLIIVNRVVGAFIGRRNEIRIEVDTINKTDQYEGVVFSRYDIQMPRVQGVAYGYNIT